MPKEFVFKDWCELHKIPGSTVEILTKDHFTEKELLMNIEYGWIASLDIEAGEKIRLRLALDKLKKGEIPVPVSPPAEADAGAVGGVGAIKKVKSEPIDFPLPRPLSDRVSSEVGSGRSCVRVVGGHTPLQVALCATCGSADGLRTDRSWPGVSGRRHPHARSARMTRSCV